jgi:hypothetical protein
MPVGGLINQIPEQFLAFNEQLKAMFGLDLADLLTEKLESGRKQEATPQASAGGDAEDATGPGPAQ